MKRISRMSMLRGRVELEGEVASSAEKNGVVE